MSQIAQELRSPLRSRELIQRTSGIAQKLIPASTNPSCEAPRANRQCSNIKDIFAPIHSQALSPVIEVGGGQNCESAGQAIKAGANATVRLLPGQSGRSIGQEWKFGEP